MLLILAIFVIEPFSALAAGDVELDISQGSITITSTGYSVDGGTEIDHTGSYKITQADSSVTTSNTITISGDDINVTISGLNISGGCPITIASGSCNLIVDGNSTLMASVNQPAIRVESGKTITISGSGELSATGGNYGAGIGGGDGGSSGTYSGRP